MVGLRRLAARMCGRRRVGVSEPLQSAFKASPKEQAVVNPEAPSPQLRNPKQLLFAAGKPTFPKGHIPHTPSSWTFKVKREGYLEDHGT